MLCAPATPTFDERALEELAQTTQTDPLEWGYPLRADVEVRETPNATAPVITKLGMHFVRVLDDESQSTSNTAGEWLRVVAPSGKIGFIPADALTSLAGTQLCYVKEGNAWKIVGLIGGGDSRSEAPGATNLRVRPGHIVGRTQVRTVRDIHAARGSD